MTLFFNVLQESYLGYCALYLCFGSGFLVLHRALPDLKGPGAWATTFFLCAAGFLFWSGTLPLLPWQFYLAGEIAHMAGFVVMLWGVFRFTGGKLSAWVWAAFGAWCLLWLASLALLRTETTVALLMNKSSRALLFLAAGWLILSRTSARSLSGRRLAGWGMVAWAGYLVLTALIKLPESTPLSHFTFGFLVGFQAISALGLVFLVVDQVRIRAEDSESRAQRLEGLLPICSYCKRIRDEEDHWQPIEGYIKARSDTDFSHGICPDCVSTQFPHLDGAKKGS